METTHRWQDLRLGYDAVGKAVRAARAGNLRPCDLETRDGLKRLQTRHPPEETSRHVTLAEAEGRRQILRLHQNLRRRWRGSEKHQIYQRTAESSGSDHTKHFRIPSEGSGCSNFYK